MNYVCQLFEFFKRENANLFSSNIKCSSFLLYIQFFTRKLKVFANIRLARTFAKMRFWIAKMINIMCFSFAYNAVWYVYAMRWKVQWYYKNDCNACSRIWVKEKWLVSFDFTKKISGVEGKFRTLKTNLLCLL